MLLGERLDAPVVINVHIRVSTLLEIDHRTGFVEGYRPVSAEQVRFMLPTAGLRRLWVNADTGAPVKVDQTVQPPEADPGGARERLRSLLTPVVVTDRAEARHDPTGRLAALIEVRDQECSGPGCSVAARRSDLDHEVCYPDGPTAPWNLAAKKPKVSPGPAQRLDRAATARRRDRLAQPARSGLPATRVLAAPPPGRRRH